MAHEQAQIELSHQISTGLLLSGAARALLYGEQPEDAPARATVRLDARGRAKLDDFSRVRELTHAFNAKFLLEEPQTNDLLEVGRVGAVACLNSVWRRLMEVWRVRVNPQGFSQAAAYISERRNLGEENGVGLMGQIAREFAEVFPPLKISRENNPPGAEIANLGQGEAFLVDLIAVRLLNENPAIDLERRLFDDSQLSQGNYDRLMSEIEAFFDAQPTISGTNYGVHRTRDDTTQNIELEEANSLWDLPLISLLRAPVERGGSSLFEQMAFIERHFAQFLPAGLLERVVRTLDTLREEAKGRWSGPPGPGPVEAPSFAGLAFEGSQELGERFSPDADWMGELVLLAKNVHVWLAQLSRSEGRAVTNLDQIPDAELETIAARGIRGLWLIGVWERSPASRRIKELSGSPHVVSSAYSIAEYRIARDLGGEQAWEDLRQRAERVGIRMAADMVPNHMGITSKWVYEHPEWFIRRADAPYPSYQFGGEDLADEEGVGIFLEDHYYERTDAAVVFKRVDFSSGLAQFIYHGNDGTSMPWNDTAQLDYLNPEVREAVIQQILAVAKKCSVIRFDAAMTLVKKHIQRLWYPEPGSAGAIPSRAEYGMNKADFDRIMPREFWVEVVERVANEAPDTLLLAEAFWMMEGYFVRSLGMHRVYNSAFMHMLSDEDNAGYRRVIKDTLAFDPEILRRYVNFMSNPDEETALAKFGRDDKYFGVFTLMATMPGLPMIGHGQIEGFAEKYGMDFNSPRLDEYPDQGLIERHEAEVFGLLRHRRFFAGVENFLLFDLYKSPANSPENAQNEVDENVFAYSNFVDGVGSLIVYHNRYADTRGWLHDSAAFRKKSDEDLKKNTNTDTNKGGNHEKDPELTRKTLLEGLFIEPADDIFVTFREQISGLEYIRPSKELAERGFFVELGAYQRQVFMNFQAVRDTPKDTYRQLSEHLEGRGVPELAAALRRREFAPLHQLFARAVEPDIVRALALGALEREQIHRHLEIIDFASGYEFGLLDEFKASDSHAEDALNSKKDASKPRSPQEHYLTEVFADFEVLFALQRAADVVPGLGADASQDQGKHLPAWAMLVAWALLRPLGGAQLDDQAGLRARSRWDEWSLDIILQDLFDTLELQSSELRAQLDDANALLRFALTRQGWLADPTTWTLTPPELLDTLLADAEARQLLRVHRHDDILWYHEESFDLFMRWLSQFAGIYATLQAVRSKEKIRPAQLEVPGTFSHAIDALSRASERARFQIERLRALV